MFPASKTGLERQQFLEPMANVPLGYQPQVVSSVFFVAFLGNGMMVPDISFLGVKTTRDEVIELPPVKDGTFLSTST